MSVAVNTSQFEQGDIIFETNTPATHIYVLEKGELRSQVWRQSSVEVGSIQERVLRESALLIGGNDRQRSVARHRSL